MALGLAIGGCFASPVVAAVVTGAYLMEDGFFLLQEDGTSKFLLD